MNEKIIFTSKQEVFWAGEFGDEYVMRNQDEILIKGNLFLFSKILSNIGKIDSIIEFGANIGLNLTAIKMLCSISNISAIEINNLAANKLKAVHSDVKVYQESIINFIPDYQRDFVFIKAVLIHINPNFLPNVYEKLYLSSKKYICIAEYYNPDPIEVFYRGHKERLFKRDFAGEMLDLYKDLRLVDYGFTYHRDGCSADDLTWFLLEKNEK